MGENLPNIDDEVEPASAGQRLYDIFESLLESSREKYGPDSSVDHSAVVSGYELRMAVTSHGELTLSMVEMGGYKQWDFQHYVDDEWVPVSFRTRHEDLDEVAAIAEQAAWRYNLAADEEKAS